MSPSGNLTDLRFVQPANNSLGRYLMLLGRVIVSRAVQPEKTLSPMEDNEEGNVTSVNAVQLVNALSLINLTESGIVIDCRSVQDMKADSSIVVRVSGKFISTSFGQCSNANFGIAFMLFGMVTDANLLQPENT